MISLTLRLRSFQGLVVRLLEQNNVFSRITTQLSGEEKDMGVNIACQSLRDGPWPAKFQFPSRKSQLVVDQCHSILDQAFESFKAYTPQAKHRRTRS